MAFLKYASILSPNFKQFSRQVRCLAIQISGEQLKTALEGIVGKENVSCTKAMRMQHSHDEGHHPPSAPDVVVWPTKVQEISEICILCNQSKTPLIPFGTGTGFEGGASAPFGGVSLDMSKMNQIIHFNPDDFDACVEPGVSRVYLNEFIRDQGLWFPIDPGADASLCGMAATSASGTNAVRYGTMRENVMNLEVVMANGTVVNTSGKGRRARKTSAGYNLTNLFVGSEGTLGVITKATIRLHALPETMVAAICSFPSVEAAINTAIMIIQSGIAIARIEFMDSEAIMACNKYSHLTLEEAPTLCMEFHGTDESIMEQAEIIGELAASNDGRDFVFAKETEKRNELWKARHNAFYAAMALRPNCKGIMTDACVPVSRLTEIIVKSKKIIFDHGFQGPIVGHVGDGNFHAMILLDAENEEEVIRSKEVIKQIGLLSLELEGTCTGEHGVGLGKKELLIKEIGNPGIQLMKSIKNAFDPNGIMNPGKVFT